jgi:NADPH-dependent 2,4-dienoyl-CoA reductase/sulfur reductase-like enzyme
MADPKRMIVVGGVAAGMSAASQAKRRKKDLEVIVFERGPWVSYGACGMPYNIQDPKRPIDDLVVITAGQFREKRGIDVRLHHEVKAVDVKKGVVVVSGGSGEETHAYDRLVIATGCRPVHPPFSGMEKDGVFLLHTLVQAEKIKGYLQDRSPGRAVVLGGGHIGLEMADVLTERGLSVTIVKRSEDVPSGYPGEIVKAVRAELEHHGVEVRTGARVLGFVGDGRVEAVHTDAGDLPADLVLVATGVTPEVGLAREAGLRIGESGAIAVDDRMQTSVEGVYAAGDCAEAYHLLLRRGVFVPRGTTANKQGRIAGANAVGADERFRGVMGTSVTKVFNLAVGHTGLMDPEAAEAGFDPVAVSIRAKTRAHAYPGSRDIDVRLVFERKTGRILGAQMAGGEGVAKRLDVLVAALHAGWTVDDLAALDLSYAPPFAPVWDPILVCANQARKKVSRDS